MSSDQIRVRADGCEWVVETGDVNAPLYLSVDGTWSATIVPDTAWFVDKDAADAARPQDRASRVKRVTSAGPGEQ
jgi:hypothetical protein